MCSWHKLLSCAHVHETNMTPQHILTPKVTIYFFNWFLQCSIFLGAQSHPVKSKNHHKHKDKSMKMPWKNSKCPINIHENPIKSTILRSPVTWWLIPLSKWVITPVINGISRVNPLVTGVITHLLSGMSHQVTLCFSQSPHLCYRKNPRINGAEAPSRSGSQARRTAAPSPDQRCDTSAAESDGRRPHEKSLKIPGISWCFYGNLRDFYGKIW